MSNEVISLTSSDEEDTAEPPSKKSKPTIMLSECTLTVVKKNNKDDKQKTIATVTLDSDEEPSKNVETKFNVSNKIPCNSSISDQKLGSSSNGTENNMDLITVTDDEEENQAKSNKINGFINSDTYSKSMNNVKNDNVEIGNETVSIDDSDTEENTPKSGKQDVKSVESEFEINKGQGNCDSITIHDSDDEMEKENHCEIQNTRTFSVNVSKKTANETLPSTSKDETSEAKALFKQFLRMVEEKIVDSSFEEILPKKLPIIQKYFNRSGTYVNDKMFETLLKNSMVDINKSTNSNGANNAVLAFHKVFDHLKSHVIETTILIEEDDVPKVKKLEKTIKLLQNKIKQLEEAEVNFEDDEDSSFIQLDRYTCRLNKVYHKYCQYIRRNPFVGRAIYDRISFVNSSYNEINLAITKKFKNSLIFPSYYELEKFITKIVEKQKLKLSEQDIKLESQKCFKILGNILQKKRRQELYDSHLSYIECTEDPAVTDISLENVLKKNFIDGEEKIEKICQKYVEKQEKGEDQVSTEQESSNESDIEEKAKEPEKGDKESEKVEIRDINIT